MDKWLLIAVLLVSGLGANLLSAQELKPTLIDSSNVLCNGAFWCAFYPDSTTLLYTGCGSEEHVRGRIVRLPIGGFPDRFAYPDSGFRTIHSVINEVTFNRDSSLVLSSGFWNIVWDMDLFDEVFYLPYLGTSVRAVYTPDNREIAVLTLFGIKVVDVETRQVVREIGRQGTNITEIEYKRGIAISPDGNLLAEGTDSGWVRMYNYHTGEKLWELQRLIWIEELQRHRGYWVDNIQFSPNGKKILVTGADYVGESLAFEAAEYDVLGEEKIRSYVAPIKVQNARYNREGTMIVGVVADSTVRIWSTKSGAELMVMRLGYRPYWAEFSAGSTRIAVAGTGGISVWELEPVTSVLEPKVVGVGGVELGAIRIDRVGGMLELPITLNQPSRVSVVLYNMEGAAVSRFDHEVLAVGTHRMRYDIQQLSTGLYFLQAEGGERTSPLMFQVIR